MALSETQRKLEDQITYRRTVEAVIGVHGSGARITEYRDIAVRPSDNIGYNPEEHDLTDAGQFGWWKNWCEASGDYEALRAEHTEDELDSIAKRAKYDDWADVVQALEDAADDDAIVSIQREVVRVA